MASFQLLAYGLFHMIQCIIFGLLRDLTALLKDVLLQLVTTRIHDCIAVLSFHSDTAILPWQLIARYEMGFLEITQKACLKRSL